MAKIDFAAISYKTKIMGSKQTWRQMISEIYSSIFIAVV